MKARLVLTGVAMLGLAAIPLTASGGSRIEFVRGPDGVAIRVYLHSVGNSVFPDHHVEASEDLRNWRTVATAQGGINIFHVREWGWNTGEAVAFFRVRERLNISGAVLAGVDLSRQSHPGANLPWADLRNAQLIGTDLSGANLRHANLRGANLSSAILRETDLSDADLEGAIIGTNELAGAALLNTRLAGGTFVTDDELAEALALDVSGELLAPSSLYLRIRRDLAAIRTRIPEAFPLYPRFEWGLPGRLWVGVTDQQLAIINATELGPASRVSNVPAMIRFSKHFHPRALEAALRWRFGLTDFQQEGVFGRGDYARFDESESKYTLSRGFGDCPSGCTEYRTWVVVMGADGQPRIVEGP